MTLKKSDLLKILVPLSKVAALTGIPVTTCIYIEGNGERLIFRATDIQQYMEDSMECGELLSPILIQAQRFLSAVNFCGDEIILGYKDNRLLVLSGQYKAEFATLDAADFPALPQVSKPIEGFPCIEVANAIDTVAWSSSTDISRIILNSVNILSDGENVIIQSTSGLEMSHYCEPKKLPLLDVIVPRENASTLASMLRNDWPTFAYDERKVWAIWKTGWYCTSRIDGNYPNTKAIIDNKDAKPIGMIARDEWLHVFQAIVQQLNFDPKGGLRTKITFEKTEAIIEGKPNVAAKQGEQGFTYRIAGNFEPMTICVNAKPFAQTLNCFEAESTLELSTYDLGPVFLKCGKLTAISTQMRC